MEGETGGGRRLGPLLAAIALAGVAAVAGVAVAAHGRPAAPRTAPPPSATPGASTLPPVLATPLPTGAAPVEEPTTAAWDSTHQVLVAYTPTDNGAPGAVHEWRGGGWSTVSPPLGSPSGGGVLVDMPPLRSVVVLETAPRAAGGPVPVRAWLWSGSSWLDLPGVTFDPCMSPASAAWDAVHGEAVVVAADSCPFSSTPAPSQTWSFDGHTWTRQGLTPAGVRWAALAWDAGEHKLAMLAAPDQSDPHAGNRAWWWSGSAWVTGGSLPGAPAPSQLIGAAWSAQAGGLVALPDGPPLAWVVRGGAWSVLYATTYPVHVLAVTSDTADGRLLVLAQTPVSPASTPDPRDTSFYLLTWTGTGWVRLP